MRTAQPNERNEPAMDVNSKCNAAARPMRSMTCKMRMICMALKRISTCL